jgi:hypothetical protein
MHFSTLEFALSKSLNSSFYCSVYAAHAKCVIAQKFGIDNLFRDFDVLISAVLAKLLILYL